MNTLTKTPRATGAPRRTTRKPITRLFLCRRCEDGTLVTELDQRGNQLPTGLVLPCQLFTADAGTMSMAATAHVLRRYAGKTRGLGYDDDANEYLRHAKEFESRGAFRLINPRQVATEAQDVLRFAVPSLTDAGLFYDVYLNKSGRGGHCGCGAYHHGNGGCKHISLCRKAVGA